MKLTYSLTNWLRAVCPATILSLGVALLSLPLKADVCGSAGGNAVVNCGFETGDFTGWTLSGNLEGGTPPNNFYGVDNLNPNSGTYEGYFGVQGGGGSAVGTLGPFLALSQTLSLRPNASYQLSFALNQNAPSNAPGYVNHFDVLFGGSQLFNETNAPNSSGYQLFNFTVSTDSTGSALLQFDFQNDSDFYFLDDVVVKTSAPVPEPATSLLLATASATLLLWRAKRRSTLGG